MKCLVSTPSSSSGSLGWLLESERLLTASVASDDYALYELMHRQAALLARVDSCYVALYRPQDNTLFFSYNFDDELYDEPLTIPLGNGPTSWVVREAKPFVLDAETEAIHNANINFGNGTRISRSALHLPLMAPGSDGASQFLGVFSVQSYEAGVYDETAIAALQLWCNRVALHLVARMQTRVQHSAMRDLQRKLREAQAHHIRISDHLVELLQPLTRQAQELSQALKGEAPLSRTQLKTQVEELCRSCYRAQTEASQLPLSSPSVHDSPDFKADPNQVNPLDGLTQAETQVLRLVAQGKTNPQIAQATNRSIDTAKKHCKLIFRKLGVSNRTEAARFYMQHAATTKNTQPGSAKSP